MYIFYYYSISIINNKVFSINFGGKMKNIYSKYNRSHEDDRPIPEPDEMLFNHPCENENLSFLPKVKVIKKGQNNKNDSK
jgi:hypothetical protein